MDLKPKISMKTVALVLTAVIGVVILTIALFPVGSNQDRKLFYSYKDVEEIKNSSYQAGYNSCYAEMCLEQSTVSDALQRAQSDVKNILETVAVSCSEYKGEETVREYDTSTRDGREALINDMRKEREANIVAYENAKALGYTLNEYKAIVAEKYSAAAILKNHMLDIYDELSEVLVVLENIDDMVLGSNNENPEVSDNLPTSNFYAAYFIVYGYLSGESYSISASEIYQLLENGLYDFQEAVEIKDTDSWQAQERKLDLLYATQPISSASSELEEYLMGGADSVDLVKVLGLLEQGLQAIEDAS